MALQVPTDSLMMEVRMKWEYEGFKACQHLSLSTLSLSQSFSFARSLCFSYTVN